MTINKIQNGTSMIFEIDGRLDTITAPQFEREIEGSLSGITELTIDLAKLAYISSAGLRVILGAEKVMSEQGKMKLINVNESTMEIFDITGFIDILTIE